MTKQYTISEIWQYGRLLLILYVCINDKIFTQKYVIIYLICGHENYLCPFIHTYRMSKRRQNCHTSDIVYCFVIDITYVMARYQIYVVVCWSQTKYKIYCLTLINQPSFSDTKCFYVSLSWRELRGRLHQRRGRERLFLAWPTMKPIS